MQNNLKRHTNHDRMSNENPSTCEPWLDSIRASNNAKLVA